MNALSNLLRFFAGSVFLYAGVIFGQAQADEGTSRFVLLLNGEAVKDAVSGLVWEREPDYIFDVWDRSVNRCATKTVGGSQGWRAPSIDEIKTLVDPEQQDPSLPAGHPFLNQTRHLVDDHSLCHRRHRGLADEFLLRSSRH